MTVTEYDMMAEKPLILLTNDDGIDSPGLLAAAEAVVSLGDILIAAPHNQQTGAGRSFIKLTDHKIYRREMAVANQTVAAYTIKGTPAQVMAIALLDLMPRPVDLVISGINFGANVGNGVTISGTVGAALEAASAGIPALAVSLETPVEYHISHSSDINFGVAAHFTHYFAVRTLQSLPLPFDVDVLKIDVPASATVETSWRMTTVSRQPYNRALPSPPEERGIWVRPGYEPHFDKELVERDSDIWAVAVDKVVSVSPLSLDLTSRVSLSVLRGHLNGSEVK